MDSNPIPIVDGKLVSGHVKNGARVRGHLLMKYLPAPEKEHPNFFHSCHEFTPEESKQLNAEGTPLLFNHNGKLGLCGQILLDHALEDESGARNAVAVLHGEGGLAGEAFSHYLNASLQEGRYTDVSLQHRYWIDHSTPTGIRKKALEISICRDKGRRPGARILGYYPTLEKKSYIRPRQRGAGVSCAAMSVSDATTTSTTTTMEVDPTPTETPKQQQQQSSSSPPAAVAKNGAVPELGSMTQFELMEMLAKQAEEKKRLEEEREELMRFKQQKMQEEQAAEQARQEALERQKQEQRTRVTDVAKSFLEALNEQYNQKTENGEEVPAVDPRMQQNIMETIQSSDGERLEDFNKLFAFASAAHNDNLKRLREREEEAARLEEEMKRQKTNQYQNRFSAALTSAASANSGGGVSQQQLSHPSSRFTNLPEAVGRNMLQEAQASNLFVPKLVPKGAAAPATSTNTPATTTAAAAASGKNKQEEPQTEEERIKEFSHWLLSNCTTVDLATARQMLQNMVGTSAASADAQPAYTPPVQLTMKHTSPEAWNMLLKQMDKRWEHGVPAYRITS